MRKARQVLLIDDQRELGKVVEMLLHIDGIHMTQALTGTDGLQLIQRQHFEALILDLDLPDIRGDEILRRLRNDPRFFNFPVIMLTGEQSLTEKVRLFDLGANDFVSKPFHAAELRARMRAILRTVAAEDSARAKAMFLAHMSHEIRTPMNGIIATTAFLLETALDDKQNSLVETIRQSGESCLGLLNDILDFSKIEAGKMEFEVQPFDLVSAVEHVFDLVAVKAEEKRLELLCCADPAFPDMVVGDRLRIQQVVLNLVSNSVKFTNQGEVCVRMKPLADWREVAPAIAKPFLEINARFQDYYLVSVRDTGIGISATALPQLFQSYTQADIGISQNYGGTGLGLAICKSVVELLGGAIWAESEFGSGSCFHFLLPKTCRPNNGKSVEPVMPPQQDPSLYAAPAAWQRANVLALAGRASTREFLDVEIRLLGLVPAVFANLADANAWLANHRPQAAILDEAFAEMECPAAAQHLRQAARSPELPIIVLTPLNYHAATPPGIAAPVSCLAKPLKRSFFRLTCQNLFIGTPAIPPEVLTVKKTPANLAETYPLRILLADDNQINQHVGSMLLQRLGYQADIVSDGQQALDALAKKTYDLLLLDVQMPVLDGIETARRIRVMETASTNTPLVIIAVTANAMKGDRDRFIEAGMDDYLAKPITPQSFQAVMARWAELVHQQRQRDRQPEPAAPVTARAPEPPAAPVMDVRRFLELAGEDDQVADELAQQFIRRTSELLPQLHAALAQNQAADARRIAHGGAGASATCGMVRLAAPLRQIETLCEAGSITEAATVFQTATSEFEQVKDYLNHRRWK
jgi:signal transduction histidine kinase/HPt (histidine-containing phosphotransfer) domain-containing protein/BarA-like signal transduction histidine kinase